MRNIIDRLLDLRNFKFNNDRTVMIFICDEAINEIKHLNDKINSLTHNLHLSNDLVKVIDANNDNFKEAFELILSIAESSNTAQFKVTTIADMVRSVLANNKGE